MIRLSAFVSAVVLFGSSMLCPAAAQSDEASDSTAKTGSRDTAYHTIVEDLEKVRANHGVTALLVAVGAGESIPVLAAAGESMSGVPANTDMHFRIGAMAIASQATILLQLVDEGLVSLDDTIDTWLPDYPAAGRVTLRMLSDSSSGYADYVTDETFIAAFYEDVFHEWTAQDLLKIAFGHGMMFDPGTNFLYAHTNFIVLAEALSAAAGVPYETLLQQRIIDRIGLKQTEIWTTAELPSPPLHAFTTERGVFEDSTYWSPSWTSATGPLNGDLSDLVKLMRSLASGETISEKGLEEMLAPTNVGKSRNTEEHYFSLGMEIVPPWIQKTFAFGGYGGTVGYLPSEDLTVAVVTTLGPDSDPEQNPSTPIFYEISTALGL